MRYILNRSFRLRGWYKLPMGLFDARQKKAVFFLKRQYLLLLKCDGAHDIALEDLEEEDRFFLKKLEEDGVIHPALIGDLLLPEQEYRSYPARYREEAHWSITGACNLRCRHCFMSAPSARHGQPDRAQLLNVVDQLAECGVPRVGITGGEPLIRPDLIDIVDALREKEIDISVIYTNGWLLDGKLLDALDARGMHPAFQLSFDGVGAHDFLRGVPGAEERTIRALRLLKERNIPVSAACSLHRGNRNTLRETVRLLADLNVSHLKCGSMMNLGEWTDPEVKHLQLTMREELETFEAYIPRYFEDDAPISIMLGGAFSYTPGDSEWSMYHVSPCPAEAEDHALSCGILARNFYIGPEGMVAPCMGMADCPVAPHFPNLFETPLRDILQESELVKYCYTTVADVRNGNDKCRKCKYLNRCKGGCRNAALIESGDFYAPVEEACYFFENGWEERIAAAAGRPFEDYCRRHPPIRAKKQEKDGKTQECP